MPRAARALGGVAIALLAAVPAGAAPPSSTPAAPDDPAFVAGLQWNLTDIGAPAAWSRGTGAGETIAIVDSGIDLSHPDLAGKVVGGTDCTGAAGDPRHCRGDGRDVDGHGTHVAGIAAAVTDNHLGVAGVAPDAQLLAVRVLSDSCSAPSCTPAGSALDVAAGIRWAAGHGADVINLSIGTTDDALAGSSVTRAIADAWAAGIVVVVAAGNGVGRADFAQLPVIVVTAVDRRLDLARYARGVGTTRWGLAAPGGLTGDTDRTCRDRVAIRGIVSTWFDRGDGTSRYSCLAGTSMAAPHVAAAAAVLRSIGYSPGATVDRLLATARDLGPPGVDTTYGAGLLDLGRAASGTGAVAAAVPSDGRAPSPGGRLISGRSGRRVPLPLAMAAGSLLALTVALVVTRLRRPPPVDDRP